MLILLTFFAVAYFLCPIINVVMILILRPYDSEEDERKERRKKLGYDI